MGVLSGVVGAAILSFSLVNSEYVGSQGGPPSTMPWLEVIAFFL
jgi:hypothetical protein